MGMSTWVIGLRTKDEPTYKKHKKVLDACLEAGIKELPEETAKYFGSKFPKDVDPEEALHIKIPKKEWDDKDMQQGYEIEVSEIPQGVEIIRFVNSW